MLNRIPGLIRRTRNRAVTANTLARFLGAGGDMAPTGITEDGAGNVTGNTYELGNVTDTTLARAAAGRASVEGNEIGLMSQGTFTPALNFGGASVGITYAAQTGNWFKMGKFVYLTLHVKLTSKGTSTGIASLTGLPFSVASIQAGEDLANLQCTSWTLTGLTMPLYGFVSGNISLRSAAVAVTDASFPANAEIWMQGVYTTDTLP